jgi:DNA-binding Xre family transcriptional regulator
MAVSYNKLWKLLIDKKMNKTELKKAAGVSWGAVTKMSKDENVSMDILIKVCKALNCNVGDIMDIISDQDS